jgi:hypothetical protein
MASAKVAVLTRKDITTTARNFRWMRKMPKWTVIVNGRELPARPLVLEAAGVPPNDPTNSHQAITILKDCGFDIRYQGKTIADASDNQIAHPVTDAFIHSVRGSGKGRTSLVEARERGHLLDEKQATE